MDIRKVLEDLNFLFKEKSIISENSYKQSIFMNFFLSLGYINDYNKGIEEIKFVQLFGVSTFLLKVIIDLDIEVYQKWQKKNRDYKTALTAINGVFNFKYPLVSSYL